jgi:hypothetical protein
MTEPAGCVTAQAHAVFGGYLPLAATGLVSTSTGPETGPPQLNVEYCNMKSTMPLGPWVVCNMIIQSCNIKIEKQRSLWYIS